VGLLPEWRTWPDPFDSDHSASAGPDLGGRNVSYQPQKMVQCGFASMELGAGYLLEQGLPGGRARVNDAVSRTAGCKRKGVASARYLRPLRPVRCRLRLKH
jgi:hypothetical protein